MDPMGYSILVYRITIRIHHPGHVDIPASNSAQETKLPKLPLSNVYGELRERFFVFFFSPFFMEDVFWGR